MTHYTSKARVAGHLRDQVGVDRVESGFQAHARRSHRGLAPRVPRAHHHYIVSFREARNHDWKPRPGGKNLL
jgi:hypothetical protein